MPDLHSLLTAEGRRLEPEATPPFDDLLLKLRRRQVRRRAATTSSVTAALVAAALGAWWWAPLSSTPTTSAAPTPTALAAAVPTPVYNRLRDLALAMAQQNGDPDPTRMEAVLVDTARPASDRQPTATSAPLTGGYIVQIEGSFVCSYCKSVRDLHGNVMSEEVSLSGLVVTDRGFGGVWQDLTRYGTPFSLTTTPAAVAASPVLPSPQVAGPTTLAAAENLALGGALNPASARIAWGIATTAGNLRAAGTDIPPAVPDATKMFVIAVHGDTMTDGSPGTAPALVHRYGVIYRGDGSTAVLGNETSFGGYFTQLEPPAMHGANVITLAQLNPTIHDVSQAPSADLADALPVDAALAAAEPAAGLKAGNTPARDVQAVLVVTHEPGGAHPLAWLLAINTSGTPAVMTIDSEYLVDASTGEAFEAVVP